MATAAMLAIARNERLRELGWTMLLQARPCADQPTLSCANQPTLSGTDQPTLPGADQPILSGIVLAAEGLQQVCL